MTALPKYWIKLEPSVTFKEFKQFWQVHPVHYGRACLKA